MSEKKPNFLVIVADDLGFTDLSAFGGEIHTPNLQKLAEKGVRFTDFHTAAACSPTRSMLLSGTDNHIAGLGQMHEFSRVHPEKFGGKPGYEGYLNDRVVSLPEILKEQGDYFTFISGKWHLGLLPEYWPVNKGFERSYTLLPGAGNHYKYIVKTEDGEDSKFLPSLYAEDDRKVDAEKELPEDFYSTTFFTDNGIKFINDEKRKGRPFFGCLTYTAPHWPFQAPEKIVAKYKGKYDDGPEELRARRLAAATKAGVVPDGIVPHPIKTIHKRWQETDAEKRAIDSRIMETYAAMVEVLDANIGRVLDHLEETGELDNTFIIFMSDNGAEGMLMEALPLTVLKIQNYIKAHYNNEFNNIGRKDSFVHYNDQWAQASTSPRSMYKMWTTEGAIVCPLILYYPPLLNKTNNTGKSLHAFTTVMDILPTILDIAGVAHPGDTYKGRKVAIPKGKSWTKYLANESPYVHSEDTVTGWELFGQQAIRRGDYKALFIPKPFGDAKWELYNLKKDPGETVNLAETEPKVLQQLLVHWTEYVAETGLIEFGSEFFKGEQILEEDTIIYNLIQ